MIDPIWNNPKFAIIPTGDPIKDEEKKIEAIHKEFEESYEKGKNNLETFSSKIW